MEDFKARLLQEEAGVDLSDIVIEGEREREIEVRLYFPFNLKIGGSRFK
jgi:hypothetical protein